MLKSRNLVRLLVVVVLLAAMIVPLAGAAVSGLAAVDSPALQAGVAGDQPAAVIACQTGDPGTSGGGCGGG